MAFRDVFEVDGAPVRDRAERLATAVSRTVAVDRRADRKILDESARYNIGDIRRNVNTPVFPCCFSDGRESVPLQVQADRRAPAARTVRGRRRRDGAFRVSTEVWVIAYRGEGFRNDD